MKQEIKEAIEKIKAWDQEAKAYKKELFVKAFLKNKENYPLLDSIIKKGLPDYFYVNHKINEEFSSALSFFAPIIHSSFISNDTVFCLWNHDFRVNSSNVFTF